MVKKMEKNDPSFLNHCHRGKFFEYPIPRESLPYGKETLKVTYDEAGNIIKVKKISSKFSLNMGQKNQ